MASSPEAPSRVYNPYTFARAVQMAVMDLPGLVIETLRISSVRNGVRWGIERLP